MPLKRQSKVLALDIGATNTRIALVTGGVVHNLEKRSTRGTASSGEFIGDIEKIIKDYQKNIKEAQKADIAIAVAGPVFDEARKLVFLTEITGDFVPFIELERLLGKEVYVINDAAAAVLAESSYGVCGENLVYLTFSSGIGGGVIKDGRLLSDKETEVGHLKIESKYQVQCVCDGINHWEAYTSGKNLPIFFEIWAREEKVNQDGFSDVFKIFEKIHGGNKLALRFAEEMHKINAKGIEMVCEAFGPDKIVLGGGLILNEGQEIIKGASKYLPRDISEKISVTVLGDEISLLGAALYANSLKLKTKR